MAKHRKIEDELEARAFLAAVDAAGGHVAPWARAHGIDGRSLQAWRVNLARAAASDRPRRARRIPSRPPTPVANGMVELVAATNPPRAAQYSIRMGVASIEFGDDFHEATLRRVVAMLRSC